MRGHQSRRKILTVLKSMRARACWEREIGEDSVACGRCIVVSTWPSVKENNTYVIRIDEDGTGQFGGTGNEEKWV